MGLPLTNKEIKFPHMGLVNLTLPTKGLLRKTSVLCPEGDLII